MLWGRLRGYCEERGMFAEEQAGFCVGRGCVQQALVPFATSVVRTRAVDLYPLCESEVGLGRARVLH